MKNKFRIIIFILAGLVLFQAVSLTVLLVKHIRLKQAFFRKKAAIAVIVKKAYLPARQITPKAAIVLDDWGYNTRNLNELFKLGQPVTISVLPNLAFSKNIARQAEQNGIEVILHLPLEAHDSQKKPEKGTIYTNMSQKEVLAKLESALEGCPGIKGVSNHMGSRATEDEKLMKLLFEQFKKKNLYFLDSLVTNDSVCSRAAGEVGIRFAERSVFLDNKSDFEYIRGQLRQLIQTAKEKKTAVGIGHDRAATIKAVKEMLPEFRREGVKLVYVSELVK